MSYTEIYGFLKNGSNEKIGETENSWRGAMKIWRILEAKYLPVYKEKYEHSAYFKKMNPDYIPSRTSDETAIREIWGLQRDDRLEEYEKIVLLSTFDNVLVRKENFKKLIEAFRKFDGDTSLKEQASIIEKFAENEESMAIGWNQSSINDNVWQEHDDEDDEDDDNDEDDDQDDYHSYDITLGDRHWWLFDFFIKTGKDDE